MTLLDRVDDLVCPETRLRVEPVETHDGETRVGRPVVARPGALYGRTSRVLLRSDRACAYPVLESGVPVLLVPEMLVPEGSERDVDLKAPQYAEAYAETEHYDRLADASRELAEAEGLERLERSSRGLRSVASVAALEPAARLEFPLPDDVWVDAPYDGLAQRDAYRHVAPIAGQKVMQLGGIGLHAVKFLLGGAAEATVVSPMPGELRFAQHLAERYEVAERLRLIVAVAEELPFADASFDAIFSGGSVHHTVTSLALPECARVLRPGGRFAAVDPWRAPFYRVGTWVFGKRERDVHCRPLTPTRVAPLFDTFDDAAVVQHGTFTRYPLVALGKLGLVPRSSTLRVVTAVDDRIASWVRVRRYGSSVVLLGRVAPTPTG